MADLIYIIEDDENIRELIQVSLQAFSYEVCSFEAAEPALEEIRRRIPSLVIFDLMLPGIDGLSATQQLRSDPATARLPIIILTAKGSEIDKVTGLDAGADDYITKPFGILELTARVRSLLRRAAQPPVSAPITTAGDLSIFPETREVLKNGNPVDLTLKEYELLKLLMENANRVVSRQELLNKVWGYSYAGETRTLDMHIRTLRQKLGDSAEHPRYIKTVRGVGFRFNQ